MATDPFQPPTLPPPNSKRRPQGVYLSEEEARRVRTSPPRMLTLMEAATYLNVGRTAVSKLIQEGSISARRVGHRVIIPLDSIDDFMTGGKL